MSYYDDCEGEFYNEPSEFDEKMEELKSFLMDSVRQDVKSDLEYYKCSAEKREKELSELRLKVKSLEAENTELHKTNDIADIVLHRLTKDNVEEIISSLFNKTFVEEGYDCALHWALYVNYYNDREQVLKILKHVGINVPYDPSVILPHEWDKSYIDKFFDRMGSHVNCNSQTYSGNLRFWSYSGAKDPFNFSCYSEIPWQFVLRNPLLNSEEYALKMAIEMSKGGDGGKFSKIDDYQKLDDNVIEILVNNIRLDKKCYKSDVGKFLTRNIDHVNDDDVMSTVFEILSGQWRSYREIAKLPEKYQIKYVNGLDETNEKIEFLKVSTLSKEKKAEILSEAL